jgi:hypothetical protein
MKRFSLSLYLVLFAITFSFAQAYDGKLEYDKKRQEAIVIEYSYPQEAVENAIIDKLESMGNQAKEEKGVFNKDKGCIVFKNATIKDISDGMFNYIVKIERKSRKDENETVVYLIMNDRDGEDMFNKGEVDYGRKAKAFLNTLHPKIESSLLDIKIKTQEGSVTKAEKKFKDLQDAQTSMEKKIKSLEEDLKENAREQEAQQKEIDAQKQALAELKGKRK